jgi:hypothetical protein
VGGGGWGAQTKARKKQKQKQTQIINFKQRALLHHLYLELGGRKLGSARALLLVVVHSHAQTLLGHLPLVNLLLNGAGGQQPVNVHLALLPVTPDPSHGLFFFFWKREKTMR